MTPAQSHALQSIYAAALDPDLWQNALDAMAAAANGVRTHLLHAGTHGALADRSLVSGYAPEYLETWDAYYSGLNAWAPGMLSLPVGIPHLCDLMCSYDQLSQTEFYADWVQPQGDIVGGGAIVLERQAGRITILGGNIPKRYRDKLDGLWMESLAIFGPAVRHAFAVNAMMLGLRLEQMLARLAGPQDITSILLLDSNRRLIFADTGGAAALEAGQVVQLQSHLRVNVVDPGVDAVLRNVVLRAKDVIQKPIVRQSALQELTFVPIDPRTAQSLRLPPMPVGCVPAVTIFIRSKSAPADTSLTRLGLSGAEADLARHLVSGKTVTEIAELRGTSVNTVRNQLRTVLQKTNCRRQTELVILLQQMMRAHL